MFEEDVANYIFILLLHCIFHNGNTQTHGRFFNNANRKNKHCKKKQNKNKRLRKRRNKAKYAVYKIIA